MSRRAVFLDKDGTLVENVPYNIDPGRVRLTSRAGEGLRLLRAEGYLLVVVSNQSGVARGYFPEGALRAVEERLRLLMAEAGAPLSGFYYCPHHVDGAAREYARPCDCRKPAPGMLLAAAREHDIDFSRSWLVGDILDDVEAGRRAGCRTVLLHPGGETEWRLTPVRTPDLYAANLFEAAMLIASDDRSPLLHTEAVHEHAVE